MIKRVKATKIGDVFEVPISPSQKRYIQYVVSDLTQLNSDVLRIFKHVYQINETPTLEEIVKDDIDYYTHGDSRFGLKMNAWTLYGNINDVGDYSNVWFKSKRDYTDEKNEDDWHVWKISGEHKHADLRETKELKAYLGLVNPYTSILYRLKTGHEEGIFSKYE